MRAKAIFMLVTTLVFLSCTNDPTLTSIRLTFNGIELETGETHSLGSTFAGTPIHCDFLLENTGVVSLVVGDSLLVSCLNGTRFSSTFVGGPTVPPGATTTLRVVFDSPSAGTFDDVLRIMHGVLAFQLNLSASAFPPI